MPKSKSRHEIKCENCSLCEKVGQFHKYNDISKLLIKVPKWDIKNDNQYKQIKNYDCLVCCFKTSTFDDWKCHVMSISHLSDCHKIANAYSYVCCNKNCKVVLYGSEESLLKHTKSHISHKNQVENKQNDCVLLSGIPTLMVEVMKRFYTKEKNLYFCSHCKKFAENVIHDENEMIQTIKNPIIHFCEFCRVEFCSSPEFIDVHSLSVEHLTLKCFYELCNVAKTNSKKIKLSEPKCIESINPSDEKNVQSVVQNALANNLVKLPVVVLNRFEKISPYKGECELCKLIKCKLCNLSVRWENNNIMSHLLNCEYKYNLTGSNKTSVKTFECNVCNYSTHFIYNHKMHMVSCLHITNCYDIDNLYSYFCNKCNKFMYSHVSAINDHWKLHIKDNNIVTKLPLMSTFMANVLKDFNTNPNRITFVHYGKIESNVFPKTITISCSYCKIEFHTSVDDYKIHKLTSEHIILKFLTPKMLVFNENNLTTTIRKLSVDDAVHDTSLLKNSDHIQVIENKQYKTGQVTKSQTNLDQSNFKHLSNVQKDEKIIENNVLVKQLEDNCKKELTPCLIKQQYTKYFNHKIKILNVLRRYKDRIIKTLTYYCDVCDFVTEEKYVWENHYQLEHKDCTFPETYCSSCSMLIVGTNNQEHYNTIEHSILLQFLNSMQIAESNLEKNFALINSVENNTSDVMPWINLDINKEPVPINKISEEMLPFQNIVNNGLKPKDKDDDKKNSEKISTLNLMNDDQNDESESDAVSNSNIAKLVSANCSKDVNKVVQKIHRSEDTLISTENVVSCDMEVGEEDNTIETLPDVTKQVNTMEVLEDIAYGEYVAQRLQLIENETAKQHIKLEIDYLFYTKIKQMSVK